MSIHPESVLETSKRSETSRNNLLSPDRFIQPSWAKPREVPPKDLKYEYTPKTYHLKFASMNKFQIGFPKPKKENKYFGEITGLDTEANIQNDLVKQYPEAILENSSIIKPVTVLDAKSSSNNTHSQLTPIKKNSATFLNLNSLAIHLKNANNQVHERKNNKIEPTNHIIGKKSICIEEKTIKIEKKTNKLDEKNKKVEEKANKDNKKSSSIQDLKSSKINKLLQEETKIDKVMGINNSLETKNKPMLESEYKDLSQCVMSKIADFKIAQIHSGACKVGKINSETKDFCPCCRLPINSIKFPLTCPVDELSELGSSFPLYFVLMKYFIFMLLLCLALACSLCLVLNFLKSKSKDYSNDKSSNLFTPATYGKSGKIEYYQPLLHFFVILIILIVYPCFLKKLKHRSVTIDVKTVTASDFTVLIKNLPHDYTKKDLKEHLEKHFSEDNVKVVNIVSTYNINEYTNYERKLNEWVYKKEFLLYCQENFGGPVKLKKFLCCEKVLESMEVIEQNIEVFSKYKEESLKKMKENGLTSHAFVIFRTQLDARIVRLELKKSGLRKFFENLCLCCLNGPNKFKENYIYTEDNPECTDVIWENLNKGASSKFFSRFLTGIVNLMLLCATFAIIQVLTRYNGKIKNDKQSGWIKIKLVNSSCSLAFVLTNIFIAKSVRMLSAFEKHTTWSTGNISVLNRLIKFMFFNIIITPVIVQSSSRDAWFDEGGLIYTIFSMQVSNAFVQPLLYFLSIGDKIKIFRRKRLLKSNGPITMSQYEACKFFEGPELDLAERFATQINTCFLSFFYAPIQPLGVLIGLLGIIAEAMVFKYMLLRVHALPKSYGPELVLEAALWVPWMCLAYSIGMVVFHSKLCPDYNFLGILILCLNIFYLIGFRSHCILNRFDTSALDKLRDASSEKPEQNYFFRQLPHFFNDYERENPCTKEEGWKRWNDFIVSKDPKDYSELFNPSGLIDHQCGKKYLDYPNLNIEKKNPVRIMANANQIAYMNNLMIYNYAYYTNIAYRY
ncbi:hypothetical protein SteCoe_30756 [Stentor coeruleus]|uniref:Uncharacterized protein n=1 Tax=Stentor coeruleus TaxID=5963 RepID=A0A1R2B2U8_9CILI|nr:hypothetical protein SteCoe_30756 [Stentor coeruleus]